MGRFAIMAAPEVHGRRRQCLSVRKTFLEKDRVTYKLDKNQIRMKDGQVCHNDSQDKHIFLNIRTNKFSYYLIGTVC